MDITSASSTPGTARAREAIRVVIVDDAIVVRGMVTRWVEAEPDMHIIAALRSGREAIEQVERLAPNVVILDVDMPDIDGITALPQLLEKQRDLVVLMASTLTRRNAEISLRALALGATDYIPKPQTSQEFSSSPSFHRELIDKVRALGTRRRQKLAQLRARLDTTIHPAGPAVARGCTASPGLVPDLPPHAPHDAAPRRLRPFSPTLPRMLVIGSSTGGHRQSTR